MDLSLLLSTVAPDSTGSRSGQTSSPTAAAASSSSTSLHRSPSLKRAANLFPSPTSHTTYHQPTSYPSLSFPGKSYRGGEEEEPARAELAQGGPPPASAPPVLLPSIASFFDLSNPQVGFYRPYGSDPRARQEGRSYASLARTMPPAPPSLASTSAHLSARPTHMIPPTPSPDLTHSHSPASSSSTLPPHTPDPTHDSPPSPSRRKRTSTDSSTTSNTPALDLLAVVAHISQTSVSGGSNASGSGSSTPARRPHEHDDRDEHDQLEEEEDGESSSASSARKRAKVGTTPTTQVVSAKKRKGRGLDPQKTRLMIFPPTLPPKSFAPRPEEGYSVRHQAPENLYAPTYTKGLDSRSRVAFCEYCGEGDLPTRMSGYGYHLLHTHNLSSHAPYTMPPPLRVRSATPSSSSTPPPILNKSEVLGVPSPGLEGECPFVDGEKRERKCALGGWHKLNSWRESMNSHLSGRGLEGGK